MYSLDDRPEPGDVVITRLEHPTTRYALSTTPGDPQVLYRSLEQAVHGARAFAQSEGVDVWLRESERELRRVAQHRMARAMHGSTKTRGES